MPQPVQPRIILEHDAANGDWSAWFADEPHQRHQGPNTRLAMKRLLDAHPDRVPADYRIHVDRSQYQTGHFELVLFANDLAPGDGEFCCECHGSGQYVGLNVVEPCGSCGGTGAIAV